MPKQKKRLKYRQSTKKQGKRQTTHKNYKTNDNSNSTENTQISLLHRFWSKWWGKTSVVGIIVSLITAISFIWQAMPRLSVPSFTEVSPVNPLATYITFSNDGFVVLEDVDFTFHTTGQIGGATLFNVTSKNNENMVKVERFCPGDKTAVPSGITAEGISTNVKVTVDVCYKPRIGFLTLWENHRVFTFKTVETSEGYALVQTAR